MADIQIGDETETQDGWSFEVTVKDGGRTHDYRVTLARDDYDRWSEGEAPPDDVVRAAFEFLLDNEPASAIMSSFDCSVIRRYFPHVDGDLPQRL